MDIFNILGLILAAVLTAAIIIGVIWLWKKGYLAQRIGFRQAATLKDIEQAEEDIKTRELEVLKEEREHAERYKKFIKKGD